MRDREVFQWLQAKIADSRQIRPDVVQLDSSLTEDLVPDSFELIELVCEIEKEFSIRIDYDEFADIKTIDDVVGFIQHRAPHH